MIALVLAFVCGTMPNWGADSLNCALEDLAQPQAVTWARLYRAVCGGGGVAERVDSAMTGNGMEACFFVADTSLCASYWITAVNGAGMESCFGQGLTLPRVVGVSNPNEVAERKWERYFDLSGRRLLSPPTTPGWYWLKTPGKKAKKIRVM